VSETADAIIVLATGGDDGGHRATLAFSWGCTALAMGRRVAVYMTMDGAIWSTRDAAQDVCVCGFEPLEVYIEQFSDLGGELLVCPPCSEQLCTLDGHAHGADLRAGAQLCGLAGVVGRTQDRTQVITF